MANVNRDRIFLAPPHMGGEELIFINEAFESNYIAPVGPQVNQFEQQFSKVTGIKHCVAVSSGTAALHLALRHLGVGRGDEVFTSDLTFIGGVSPVVFLGATPVFIDSDRESWNMDPNLLAEELHRCSKKGRLPKAVVPTDLYGQCADYDRIHTVCSEYRVPVVVDAAEALGARYWGNRNPTGGNDDHHQYCQDVPADCSRHAGKGARAAVFSFNGNKIITTSGGGILASDDDALVQHARFLSEQARDPFPHYEHSEIGYNYRMSNILAAIGRGQLRVLSERVKRKREIFACYRHHLGDMPGIDFMPEAPYGAATRWLVVMLVDPIAFGADSETIRLALEAENIESRLVWKPMHMQPVFRQAKKATATDKVLGYKSRRVGGEVAEDLFHRGLCLPSGTAMKDSQIERIVEIIHRCR